MTMCAYVVIGDPYGFYGALSGSGMGIPERVPDRIAKSFAVFGKRPTRIVLGTSRVHIGFPTSLFRGSGEDTYNLGVNEASVYEIRRLLQNADSHAELEEVWIFLDFASFRDPQSSFQRINDGTLPVSAAGNMSLAAPLHLLAATYSWSAVRAAWSAHRDQSLAYDQHGNSLRGRSSIPVDQLPRVATGVLAGLAYRANPQWYPERFATTEAYRELMRSIADACSSGAQVHLGINPLHITHFAMMDVAGSAAKLSDWRRSVFRASKEAPADCLSDGMWDFTLMADQSFEFIPLQQTTTVAPVYWLEPSHFTAALGADVISWIKFGSSSSPYRVSSLSELEMNIERDQRLLEGWKSTHPGDVAHIREIYAGQRVRTAAPGPDAKLLPEAAP